MFYLIVNFRDLGVESPCRGAIGLRQTEQLRQKIAAERCADVECTEREQRFYDSFHSRQQQIYCSPFLRALQTAHLTLPEEDGWGSIKLLKDAREKFSFVFERDNLGTDVGLVMCKGD